MPVAVEISVTATGAKPSGGTGERELFTEETSTVLVLPDGAVIRLAAAVIQSQLIFLTNNTTKREVVCQVLRKRSYRPTSCYVELQFTEAAADFWGVDFLTEEVVAGAKESEAVEEVEAAEAIVEEPSVAVSAPSDKEVLKLRGEVEALRAQLQSLIVKKEESGPAASVGKIDVAEALQMARSLAANSASNAQAEEEKASGEVGRESQAGSSQEDAMEQLLPEVELDFSRVPAMVRDEGLAGPNGRPPLVDGRKFVRIGGYLVVLVLVVFGAWFNNWLPFLKRTAESARPTFAGNVGRAVAKVVAAGKAATSGVPAGSVDAKSEVVDEAGQSRETLEAKKSSSGEKNFPAKAGVEKNSRKRGQNSSDAPADVVVDAPADAPITDAKLVQAVNPVYPPDAMRNYITGDVRLDAVVEADGRVGAMSVVSGPAPLRAAAMEALKQYKYSAATQNGKGVASHVRVTIKFWFDP